MTNSRFRAITTRYKGFAFRSRHEARWAIYFDHLGVKWDYEPEGFELGNGLRYLPDFWLPDWDMWVEIKPDAPDPVSLEKARRLVEYQTKPVYITSGMPDRNGVLLCYRPDGDVQDVPAFAYFDSANPCVLSFPTSYEDAPPSRCGRAFVGALPFDKRRAEAGAAMAGRTQEALFAARAARFEFGEKGGAK